MKESGITWCGDIPAHWQIMANKYIMLKKKEICPIYKGQDILSLTMNGVIVRNLEAGGKMPTSFDGYQKIYPNNLLMCLFDYDVTPRCIGLIKNEGLTSPAYSQFIMKNENSSRYYYYYYLMIDNTKELLHLAKNLRHSFTEDQLGAIKTPVPPLDEQNRIAEFLDDRCAEIDAISSEIQEQINTLEEYKKSVITEAVTKGLNPNAEMKDSGVDYIGKMNGTWKLTRIGYICSKLIRTFDSDATPLICSNSGEVFERGENNIGLVTDNDSAFQGVASGDLLIHGMDTWHGAIAISNLNGKCTTVVHVCDSTENKHFIKYFLQMLAFKKVYKAISNGVRGNTSDFRSWEKTGKIYITIPNRPEQDLIADYLNKLCSEIEDVIKDQKKQLETLEDYKKTLIYEYVTGKKEVA